MSFDESMFLAGFIQKTTKEDLHVNLITQIHHETNSRRLREATPEADPERLPGGADRPHHGAARPFVGFGVSPLLEGSSTAS
jgi:hypothetical protein